VTGITRLRDFIAVASLQPQSYSEKMFARQKVRAAATIALALALFAGPLLTQDADWQKSNSEWREAHTKDLLKPDGWLSLAGLEWLEAGDNTVGASSDNRIRLGTGPAHLMVLHLEAEAVTLQPPPGGFSKDLMVNGEPAKVQPLTAEGNKDKLSPHITIGTLNAYVIRREKRFALRIKDSQSGGITGFHGLKWFVADPSYRVTAKWIPYLPAKKLMLTTLVGTSYEQPVPGAAEFVLKGKTYRIEPVVEDPEVPKLFFILRDTTSKSSTYGACRFLYTGFPTNGVEKAGELVLDFNRLENPPCAYTPFSTCPLPPSGNRLPIALPVGEKRYHE
jgi:uncharacterized protein (DUF1684 family)